MGDSLRAGVVSSSRGCAGGQRLGIEQLAEVNQGGEGDTRLGCVAEGTASNGVEHPRGEGESGAISKPNEVAVSSQAPEAADDEDLLVV